MQKRRKQKSRNRQAKKVTKMSEQNISQVGEWIARIKVNSDRAICLSQKMSADNWDESNDLFWAVVKYAENVHESATGLDKINKKIYPCLVEIPMKAEQENSTKVPTKALNWESLKGMRIKLAHQFWSIDANILRETVTVDFPRLMALLSTLTVVETFHESPPSLRFDFAHFHSIPPSEAGTNAELGNSLPFLYFSNDGNPHIIRLGHTKGGELLISSSDPGRYSLTLYEEQTLK